VGDKFIIGKMAYSTVVIPEHLRFFENTDKLLAQFKANGGRIVTPDQVKERTDVIDNPNVLYTKRKFADRDVYFFVNCTKETQTATITPGSYIIDLYTGEAKPFAGTYTFAPCEGLLVADDGAAKAEPTQKKLQSLPLDGLWDIAEVTPNVLTLDTCDYWFDGNLEEKNAYVLNIQLRALRLERPVHIRQEYRVNVETCPKGELFLVCETPEIYTITVNGRPVSTQSKGWFADRSFQKLDISGMLTEGQNIIALETDFSQSAQIYERVRRSYVASAERNKLSYEMEIEPCYLIGDFGVRLNGTVTAGERNDFLFDGSFSLCEPTRKITLTEIEKQGYPFFAGTMTVTKEFDLDHTNYRLKLLRQGINAVEIAINGQTVDTVLFMGDTVDCSGYLQKGRNTVTLKLIGNLRNMLGPHHLAQECLRVKPALFYKELCPWPGPYEWVEQYCFVNLSVQETE